MSGASDSLFPPRLDEPLPGFACPFCSRSFESERGVQVHVGVSHKGRRRTAGLPLNRTFPGVEMPTGLHDPHHYRAVYDCDHSTELHGSWNVVVDAETGPFEGYCRSCDRMRPIAKFIELEGENP